METPEEVTIAESGNMAIPSGIEITLNINGIMYNRLYGIDTDPEYLGKLVENTIRKSPKHIRYE